MLARFIFDESGATALEYAMLVGLLSMLILAALRILGPVTTGFVSSLSTSLMKSASSIPS